MLAHAEIEHKGAGRDARKRAGVVREARTAQRYAEQARVVAKRSQRRRIAMRWKWIVGLAGVHFASAVLAADRPVIDVSPSGLAPERIEVHVGETIRWRAERGVRMRIEFDPHRNAHEVI